jgi:phospholipid N-methyltransferase
VTFCLSSGRRGAARREVFVPDISTPLHLDMLHAFLTKRRFGGRLRQAARVLFLPDIYGLQWGDPETVAPLRFVRDRYVLPYVNARHVAVEIGPGGGRWTRYLLTFRTLYVVDYYAELLAELRKHYNRPNQVFVKNNGSDFPGIATNTVDYLFAFGTFVHLEADVIAQYLTSMKAILKPGANVVIQYSDKTKVMAQHENAFSDNTPETMRRMVATAGYRVLEEDLTTLWHSSIIRFTV